MRAEIKRISVLAIVLALTIAGARETEALEGPGASVGAYIELPTGPVSAAMGETCVSLENDPFAWLSNPAILSRTADFGVGISHSEWILDTRLEYAVLHRRVNKLITLGAGIIYRNSPEIQGYDEFGEPTEMLDNGSYKASISMAIAPIPGLGIGLSASYFRETLAEWSAGGPSADIGVFYSWPAPSISIGMAARNLGADISFDGTNEPLPSMVTAGFSFAFDIVPVIAEMRTSVDLVKPRFEGLFANVGAECTIGGMLSIRAGWCGRENREGSGITLGAGAKIAGRLQADYAYSPYGDLGNFHRIGLHFSAP